MPKGEYLQYGGQAIIEGVMMRSPRYFSIACRAPNGKIVQTTEPLEKTWIGRQKWLKAPFLRGSWALLDAMTLGVKAMRFASSVQLDPENQKPDSPDAAKPMNKNVQEIAVGATVVVSLVFGMFLFNVVPNALAELLRNTGQKNGTVINFATEMVKVIFFLGYIMAIGQMNEIKEVFKYHGAEHKAINTLEAEQPLTLENCEKQTRLHPRCGTSFAIIVLIVSIIVSTLTPRYLVTGGQGNYLIDVAARVLLEIFVLLPIISGISYELIRFAGKFRNTAFVNAMFAPGLMSQYLTTREPRPDQIDVALLALQAVVDAEAAAVPA